MDYIEAVPMHSNRNRRRAVITGMGVIAPNGQDLDTFWRTVRDGISAARRVTQFDVSQSPHQVAAEIPDFDSHWFLDSRKARRYDKCIKYALAAAILAIKDSGLALDSLNPDRLAVVEGTTLSGLESQIKAHVEYFEGDSDSLNPFHIINGYCGEGSSIIALELGLKGHAITLCSGCCASNDAIGYAAQMVQDDEADVMIAGGADANLLAPLWASFTALRVMTKRAENPAAAMRPFDRSRDGFVLGDGAGFLVIEELSHALSRGAKIYAEVLGHGRSCEAYHMVNLHPEGLGIVRAMEKALRRARLHPTEVEYINAHGTATKTNDPIETKAIKKLFGAHAARLAVSSTKPVTGHAMGGAGALETIICALSIKHQTIPPTINLEVADEGCDLDYVPNQPRAYPLKVVMNLNSGFGGKNSCLILGRHRDGST
jgi:3-oxoacyl-[acyl-carrier-protein] synthase II